MDLGGAEKNINKVSKVEKSLSETFVFLKAGLVFYYPTKL